MSPAQTQRSPGNRIAQLYRELRKTHGRPAGQWSLWCKRPKTDAEKEIIIVESVLTQQANWRNVELAVGNLEKAGLLSLEGIEGARVDELAGLIRPCGFYRQKATRLQGLASFFVEDCRGPANAGRIPLSRLRPLLLSHPGIGPETADDILLYALQRPVFVVDEYTRRLARALALTPDLSYYGLQSLFSASVRKDYRLYQDFHALIVIDGKRR
jgi:endonuclease-3 related protein